MKAHQAVITTITDRCLLTYFTQAQSATNTLPKMYHGLLCNFSIKAFLAI